MWKTREEKPEEGSYIIALSWHWKSAFPSSLELIGGVVDYSNDGLKWRVCTDDYTGNGGYGWHSDNHCELNAWMYAEDFLKEFPGFMPPFFEIKEKLFKK